MPSALVDTSRDSDSGSPRDRDAAEAMRMGLSLAASIIPDLETQNRNLNLDAARSVRGKQAYKTMLEEADAELKATAGTNCERHGYVSLFLTTVVQRESKSPQINFVTLKKS